MGFKNQIIKGSGALIRAAIKSPNYVAGVAGWFIGRDGTAEFNDVTIRGDLESSNFVTGTSGWKLDQLGPAEFQQVIVDGAVVDDAIKSTGYDAGAASGDPFAGWKIEDAGDAEFTSIAIGSDEYQIDSEGNASFATLGVSGALTVAGVDINDLIAQTLGLIAHIQVSGTSAATTGNHSPQVEVTNTDAYATNQATIDFTLPTGIGNKWFILVVVVLEGLRTDATAPTTGGFTVLARSTVNPTTFILGKISDGNDSGDTHSVGCPTSASGCAVSAAYSGNFDSIVEGTGWEISAIASGGGAAINATLVTPTWGLDDNVALCVGGAADDGDAITVFPSGYTHSQIQVNGGGGLNNDALAFMAAIQETATSHDPAAATLGGSESWVAWTVAIRPSASVNDVELFSFAVADIAEHVYCVTWAGLAIDVNAFTGDWAEVYATVAYDVAADTTDDVIMTHRVDGLSANDVNHFDITGVVRTATADAGKDMHITFWLRAESGSAGVDVVAQPNSAVTVCDLGAVLPANAIVLTGGTPPSAETQTTKTYTATSTKAFSGTTGNVTSSTEGREGSFPGTTNGNQKSAFGFDHATIQTDLSGSTIDKCEVFLYFDHWWFGAGGTAILGTHNDTDVSTATNQSQISSQSTNRVQSASWPRNHGRWVDVGVTIGEELRDNTAKGLMIGPGPTTSGTYYGKTHGHGETYPPQLRITYTV